MKVLIIGAGATGSITAKLLSGKPEIEQVVICDIDANKAKKFINPDPKTVFKVLDAKDSKAVVEAAKGMNLLVNASLPSFNESLMKVALEAKVNYQDFASNWDDGKVEQLKYQADFKAAGLRAMINSSASPGLTNLIAKDLSSQLKRIEYIKIRLLEDVSSDVPFTAWSKAIFFDEIFHKPWTWEFDKFMEKNNFADEEYFDFPEPFDNTRCYLLSQEDMGTIPMYIKTKYIDLKAGGSEIEFARTLFKLGLFKKRPVKIGEALVAPYDFLLKLWPDILHPESMKKLVASGKLHNAHFWCSIEEKGIRDKKKIIRKADILFPNQEEINKLYPGANYVSYAAGLSAAIFAMTILKIKDPGVFPPEALDAEIRSSLIEEFRKNKIVINVTEKELSAPTPAPVAPATA